MPTSAPTARPTLAPTATPTMVPTSSPTCAPSSLPPSSIPTRFPSLPMGNPTLVKALLEDSSDQIKSLMAPHDHLLLDIGRNADGTMHMHSSVSQTPFDATHLPTTFPTILRIHTSHSTFLVLKHAQVTGTLSSLSDQEQFVLKLRFGINGTKRHTPTEIGALLDPPRCRRVRGPPHHTCQSNRVREIEVRALHKLRDLEDSVPTQAPTALEPSSAPSSPTETPSAAPTLPTAAPTNKHFAHAASYRESAEADLIAAAVRAAEERTEEPSSGDRSASKPEATATSSASEPVVSVHVVPKTSDADNFFQDVATTQQGAISNAEYSWHMRRTGQGAATVLAGGEPPPP